MSVFKIINSGFYGKRDMENLVYYVFADQKHVIDGYTGGQFLLITDWKDILDQIIWVKKQYKKMDGRQLQHMILSVAAEEMKYLDLSGLMVQENLQQ